MTEAASTEALRIVRSLEVEFPTGPSKRGSAFVVAPGQLVTCAHVVVNDANERASGITVQDRDRQKYPATVGAVDPQYDLARLDAEAENSIAPTIGTEAPPVGRQVVFAGQPKGVTRPGVFFGIVSDYGTNLVQDPRCDLIQISGMINYGNSGGPLLDALDGCIIGVITAKHVPLLTEIDKLETSLRGIPQIPSDVTVGKVDFAKFVNLTVRSMWQLATVLRLVQVGTGWAVPAQFFAKVGV